jgi:hypothetical protein
MFSRNDESDGYFEVGREPLEIGNAIPLLVLGGLQVTAFVVAYLLFIYLGYGR